MIENFADLVWLFLDWDGRRWAQSGLPHDKTGGGQTGFAAVRSRMVYEQMSLNRALLH